MNETEDWRLVNDVGFLKYVELNPTDGEEIISKVSHLKKCIFCYSEVQNTPHQRWFLPTDLNCCICENCHSDFKELFHWKDLDGWDIDWTIE